MSTVPSVVVERSILVVSSWSVIYFMSGKQQFWFRENNTVSQNYVDERERQGKRFHIDYQKHLLSVGEISSTYRFPKIPKAVKSLYVNRSRLRCFSIRVDLINCFRLFNGNVPIIKVPGKKGRKVALLAAFKQNKGVTTNIWRILYYHREQKKTKRMRDVMILLWCVIIDRWSVWCLAERIFEMFFIKTRAGPLG